MPFTVCHTSIRLERLHFYAYHGLLPAERIIGGEYIVDVTLHIPSPTAAMQSDDIRDTINYADAYHVINDVMQQPCNLLEHVAYRISRQLYTNFPFLTAIDLSITKVTPPMGGQCEGATFSLSSTR